MRTEFMGINIDNLTMDETLNAAVVFIETKKPHQHVVVNVNKIIKANRDEHFRRIINRCDLINVDGMPIVWVSKILKKPLKERIAGIDLFLNLLKKAEEKGYKIYLLGAKQEVVSKVVEIIKKKHPNLNIIGFRNGYWTEEEEMDIVESIKSLEPDILFIALSSPKKEIFTDKYLKYLSVPFVMGVGGSFDVLAGKIKRAPLWAQKMCLEWFYRFLQEPKRFFKRYFIEGPHFLYLIFKELLSHKPKAI